MATVLFLFMWLGFPCCLSATLGVYNNDNYIFYINHVIMTVFKEILGKFLIDHFPTFFFVDLQFSINFFINWLFSYHIFVNWPFSINLYVNLPLSYNLILNWPFSVQYFALAIFFKFLGNIMVFWSQDRSVSYPYCGISSILSFIRILCQFFKRYKISLFKAME